MVAKYRSTYRSTATINETVVIRNDDYVIVTDMRAYGAKFHVCTLVGFVTKYMKPADCTLENVQREIEKSEALDRKMNRITEYVFFTPEATVIYDRKVYGDWPEPKRIAVTLGQRVQIVGLGYFTIERAPNDNVNLVPAE